MDDMKKLEDAEEYANHLVECANLKPQSLLEDESPSHWKSIHDKLLDLFVEESNDFPYFKEHCTTSHLLDKLVKKENLNALVVNLYPDNEGYTLMLKGKRSMAGDTETVRMPYEECDILDYIDHEELPPILVDLLDKSQANLFYSGCIIAEVRDFRRTRSNMYDSRYVLLKPTAHTLLCDMNAMTTDGHRWTQEDKFSLESQLLMHTNEDLCLDPSPATFLIHNHINRQPLSISGRLMRRFVKKFSQASINRKRKLAQCAAPQHLKLHDFVTKRSKLKRLTSHTKGTIASKVDTWRQRDIVLAPPDQIDVDKYAKVFEKPKITGDNTLVLVEECTWEATCIDNNPNFVHLSKLAVYKRPNSDLYVGEMSMVKNYNKETKDSASGSTNRFNLGTRSSVDQYISQFTDIVTEVGKWPVKMRRRVAYTPGLIGVLSNLQAGGTPTSQALLGSMGSQGVTDMNRVNLSVQLGSTATKITNISTNNTGSTMMPSLSMAKQQSHPAQLSQPMTSKQDATSPNKMSAAYNRSVSMPVSVAVAKTPDNKVMLTPTRRKSQTHSIAKQTSDAALVGQVTNINLANIAAVPSNLTAIQVAGSQGNIVGVLGSQQGGVVSGGTTLVTVVSAANSNNTTGTGTISPGSVGSGMSVPGAGATVLPLGVQNKFTAGAAQFVQSGGIKASAQNIAHSTPISLLQLQGQPGIQLLPQQQQQLAALQQQQQQLQQQAQSTPISPILYAQKSHDVSNTGTAIGSQQVIHIPSQQPISVHMQKPHTALKPKANRTKKSPK